MVTGWTSILLCGNVPLQSMSAPSPLSWAPPPQPFYDLPTVYLHLGYFTSCVKLDAWLSHITKLAPIFQVPPPIKLPKPETWDSTSSHSPALSRTFPGFVLTIPHPRKCLHPSKLGQLASWSQLKCCPLPSTLSSWSPSPVNPGSLRGLSPFLSGSSGFHFPHGGPSILLPIPLSTVIPSSSVSTATRETFLKRAPQACVCILTHTAAWALWMGPLYLQGNTQAP